jgi:lysophospholipase L1-like esterase
MMYTFLTISLLLITASCSKPDEPMTEKQPLTYLALGDSYTIGQGVPENERWPIVLADTLRKSGIYLQQPQIIARTGWTTAELKSGIAQANPEGPFDLVSLLIGVNNQYRGVSRGYTLEGYRQEFEELLQMAIDFAGGDPKKVFVVSIPDYSVTPFVVQSNKQKVSREIEEYNQVNLDVSNSQGVSYFNITPVSRLAQQDPELLAGDGLHPSGKMYRMWVDAMVGELVTNILNN